MTITTKCFTAALACTVCGLFAPYPATAQGGFNSPGRYEITNVKSGKVLDL
ncbi:MAG: hypothetical protein JNK48_22375, partial [Bryobacterales bacterium]|nr:hypothetical protein [Bryobacterales bacterium]